MSAARCRKADAAFAVAKICRAVHLSVRSESGKKNVTHRQHSNPCGAALELCRSAAHAGFVRRPMQDAERESPTGTHLRGSAPPGQRTSGARYQGDNGY